MSEKSSFDALAAPTADPVIALGEEADRNGGMNIVIGAYRDEAGRLRADLLMETKKNQSA